MTEQVIDWETFKEKGNEAYKKKNYDEAIKYYSDAIMCNSSQDTLYSNRALCYISQKRYRLAIYDLNKCLDINHKNIKALKRLALIHQNLGNFQESDNFQQKCINFEPKEPSHKQDLQAIRLLTMKYNEMEKKYQENDFVATLNLSQEILLKCVDSIKIKKIYVESLIKNVKLAEAMAYITSSISQEDHSQTDDFYYFLAQAFYYDGKYEKSKNLLNAIVNRNKENMNFIKLSDLVRRVESEKEAANDAFKKADYDNAILLYTNLLEIDPENKNFNSTILANRALCYQKKGKPLDALTDINKSIATNENYTKAYMRRGHIHYELKNFEEARYDYEKVKTLEPTNTDAKRLVEECKKQEKIAKKKDYYKTLGLSRDASTDEIRKAYKRLSKENHPDKNTESEESKKNAEKKFKEINEAYKILSDPKTKAMVDNGQDPNDQEEGGMHGGVDISDILRMFGGGVRMNMGGHSHGEGQRSSRGQHHHSHFDFGGFH